MSRLARSTIASLALLLFLSGCGPFLLIPGGKLSGGIAEVPSDWSFTKDINTVQLECRPSDPYSVNIWATGVGQDLYLHAGANRANWVEFIEADPRVRIRIEDRIYELRATRVEDPAEFKRFANAYDEKYGVRPRNENVAEVYLMRLESR
jgi:hypothetical protein